MIPKFNNIYKFNKLTHKRRGAKTFLFCPSAFFDLLTAFVKAKQYYSL